MDIKNLKDTAVVSINKGEKVGTVDDVLIDSQHRRVAAFNVQSGGFLRHSSSCLPFGAVQSIGKDAIMIQDSDVLKDKYEGTPPEMHNYGNVTSVRVVTDTGTYVGNVSSVHFEPADGHITEYEVSPGGISGVFGSSKLIDSASITSIGEDIMIVPAAVAEGQASA
jgi:uncharacterized protein YrrD